MLISFFLFRFGALIVSFFGGSGGFISFLISTLTLVFLVPFLEEQLANFFAAIFFGFFA